MSYSLHVEVVREQVEFLKENGYTLCIARANSVPDSPNFIWASTDFLVSNKFQWTNTFKIFGSLTLHKGDLIAYEETERKSINFGQTCTIDASGIISDATGSFQPESGQFMLKNEHVPMNVGVTCSLTLPGEADAHDLPFYLSKEKVVTGGTDYLTPLGQVTVWFQEDHKTPAMVEHVVGLGYTLDFSGSNPNPQTVSYNKAGQWQLGPLPTEEPKGSAGQ